MSKASCSSMSRSLIVMRALLQICPRRRCIAASKSAPDDMVDMGAGVSRPLDDRRENGGRGPSELLIGAAAIWSELVSPQRRSRSTEDIISSDDLLSRLVLRLSDEALAFR